MNPSERIREHYRALAEATVAKRAADCYREGRLDRESWQRLADEGLWRLSMPAQYGGDGGTWWDFIAAFEGIAIGGRDLGFNLSLVAHAGLLRSTLIYLSPQQLERYLPPLISGAVGATALTEPQGGSDVARVRTCATRVRNGFIIDGQKDHITHGPVADLALVLGRLPEIGDRDISLFLVDMTAPGVERGEVEDMIGNRSSPTGPFRLSQVALPADALVGCPGNGLQIIYDTISLDRLLYGVLAAAYLEPILTDTLQYARERIAFKYPIIDYQYVQGRLTDLQMAIDTTRAVSYRALEALLQEDPQANMLCSIAKYQGAENLRTGTEHAFRVMGHLGYMRGPVAQQLIDAYGTLIAGGTAEMQRKNIFNQMLHTQGAVV
ncbi:acyl-CoA dehydrogenase family protein [Frankia sp. CiP3]|uniref:acyl-CoA dehydrogenase family protein n=1 Tax=Frankia sp. CiP3 TaxID=2880971 RepID=UPI001EF4B8C9|nr:acyl-CoA dehydrogenase family protein [Frankia sp. CiP3]